MMKNGNTAIVAAILIAGILALIPAGVREDLTDGLRGQVPSASQQDEGTDVEVGATPSRSEGEDLLSEVEVADPAGGPGEATDYDRDAFGPSWKDVDRNGCDTRIICT